MKALSDSHAVSLLAVTDDEADDHVLYEKIQLKQVRRIALSSTTRHKRKQQVMSIVLRKSYLLNRYNRKEIQQEIDRILSHDHFDAVIFESIFMAGYRVPKGISVIIDQHNIEYELLYRTYYHEKTWSRKLYNWWESKHIKPVELARCSNAQGVLVTSERELLLLKNLLPRSIIEVVPNGVDIDTFVENEEKQAINQIIFTGTMNYYPNIDAVLFFARECWPLIRIQVPEATWQIVGKAPPLEVQRLAQLPGVSVTGAVPDVKPFLAAATVAIAPLFIGSGTRLKILEAFAMKKTVVSTSIGCEGLAVIAGKHLLIANQPREFSQSVVDALTHAELRLALGNAGRELVETQYSWRQCGDKALQALTKMVR